MCQILVKHRLSLFNLVLFYVFVFPILFFERELGGLSSVKWKQCVVDRNKTCGAEHGNYPARREIERSLFLCTAMVG